ncbi:hypothetical protein AALO_G00035730 [Alosa alosa]|uniref:Uncharacterized protein n=1 Tax=Alosa alosa TaxID=278164 RepID=A0AAV6H8D9_9TELE|nr:hypothetical protein AALO_G00035730 [Alosa alosa]
MLSGKRRELIRQHCYDLTLSPCTSTDLGNRGTDHKYHLLVSHPVPWLATVSLQFSFLGFIRRHQLSCLSHLTVLDLVANGISDVEDYSFEGLGQLRRLQVSFNNISVIREWTFSGLTALQTLPAAPGPAAVLPLRQRLAGQLGARVRAGGGGGDPSGAGGATLPAGRDGQPQLPALR